MVSNLRCSGRRALTAVVAVISIVTGVSSFSTQPSSIVATRPSTRLSALPTPERYDTTYNAKPPTYSKDTQLWTPSSETEDVPYGPDHVHHTTPNQPLVYVQPFRANS